MMIGNKMTNYRAKFNALSTTKKVLSVWAFTIVAALLTPGFEVFNFASPKIMTQEEIKAAQLQTKYRKEANCKLLNQECPEYTVAIVKKN